MRQKRFPHCYLPPERPRLFLSAERAVSIFKSNRGRPIWMLSRQSKIIRSAMPNTPLQYMLFLLLPASAGCRDSPAPSPQIDKSASSGDRLMSQGRYGEALQAYRRAAKRRPEAAEIQRKLAAAEEAYQRAMTSEEKFVFDLEGCLSIDASWPRPPYATIPK